MNKEEKSDYINYRLNKAIESLTDAKLLAKNNRWNACTNRLYYASFYAVNVLLLKNNFKIQTHDGVRSLFNLHFIKTGKINKEFGKLFSKLFDWRQKGDYGDLFDFDEEQVYPLIKSVDNF